MTEDVDAPIITPSLTGEPQFGNPLTPGTYTFSAWVKAGKVQGSAGWFYHVYKGHNMVLNNTLNTNSAATGWSYVTETVTVPEGADTVQVGTSLPGTRTAYFDDAI